MSETATVAAPAAKPSEHAAFFRQSGWLMMANIIGGFMTLGVHILNKRITPAEYTIFVTLLSMVSCMPVTPLQMVFAQQTAQAVALNRQRQLASMIRMTWLWSFILWALAAVVILYFQHDIATKWELPNTVGIWVTLPVLLVAIWMPLFSGILQGDQDFFGLGWSLICGGAGRLVVAAILVIGFASQSTGMMAGALGGLGLQAGIAIWRSRHLWGGPGESFPVRPLLAQIVPLMLGFGACQFMFTSDTMFAKAFFDGEALKPYAAAGTLSRGLLWLVMPLATVMFPKIVHSRVKKEQSNLSGLVVLGTAALAVCGGIGLWLFGPLVVKVIYESGDVASAMALIPWYAVAMIPLAMANVLANDLLARGRFAVVPFMVLLAVAYGFGLPLMLHHFPGRLEVVLQTLAFFNLLLFGACAIFAWVIKEKRPA